MKKIVVIFMVSFLFLSIQSAWAGRLDNGASMIFVFKNKDALEEFTTLQTDGVCSENILLCLVYVACVVDSGTRASITDSGFLTHDIIVTSGIETGCRGNIPVEWYHSE